MTDEPLMDGGFENAPQDVGAEQAVLGAMILSKDALAAVVEALDGRDFYRPAHALIFGRIVDLYGQGKDVDAVTLVGALAAAGEIGKAGGGEYVHTLLSSVPVVAAAPSYARQVQETAVRRRLQEAGMRIQQLSQSPAGHVDDLVARAQQTVTDVSGSRQSEDLTVLEHLLQPALDELEAIGSRGAQLTGVPTGFRDLDEITHGLHPGQLVVIAGRPGHGKSTMGLDIARTAAITHGMTAAVFSLEMSKVEITMRLLSAEGKVPLHNMRAGRMVDDDWERISKRMGEVAEAPLYVDDSTNLTLTAIRAKARRLKETVGLKLIVIDYLQLMTGQRGEGGRQQEVADLSRSLKLLAKELEIPVVVMSQLNRGPEQRTDKKPMISDLRESGAVEQDADVVILLHRPDAYDKEERPGECDFIVAKQRNGPTGTITVAFQGHYSRFTDLAFGY